MYITQIVIDTSCVPHRDLCLAFAVSAVLCALQQIRTRVEEMKRKTECRTRMPNSMNFVCCSALLSNSEKQARPAIAACWLSLGVTGENARQLWREVGVCVRAMGCFRDAVEWLHRIGALCPSGVRHCNGGDRNEHGGT